MKMLSSLLRVWCLLAAGLALPLFAAAGEPLRLTLTYYGNGTVAANQTHVENRYNFKTKKFESALVTDSGRKSFSGSGSIELNGSNGRIKLPSAMVPLLNGGNGGWFSINDLWVNEDEITGVVRINGLNKPKLRVDRRSGQLSIEGGLSEFNGQCELARSGGEARRF